MKSKLDLLDTIMNLNDDYKMDRDWVIRNVLNIKPNELRSEKIKKIWKKDTQRVSFFYFIRILNFYV